MGQWARCKEIEGSPIQITARGHTEHCRQGRAPYKALPAGGLSYTALPAEDGDGEAALAVGVGCSRASQ